MKTSTFILFFLSGILFFTVNAQTVNATYLNPQFIDANYNYLRFGSSTDYKAGFMWNNSSSYYGNGDDFTLFSYNNRDITIRPGNTGNFIVFPTNTGGNMGIGTSNPEEKLEIKDGSILVNGLSPSITVKNRTAGVGSWVDLAAAPCTGCYSKFAKKGSIVLRGVSYNGDFLITNPGNTGITFATGNWDNATNPQRERMTITNTGNVGIGTMNPEAKLHVSTGVKLRKTSIGVTVGSPDNSWVRDEWLTGNYGPVKWNQTIKKWVRPSGTYNDFGGIVYQDEGTYFIREHGGAKLEYTNQELLDTAFMYADIFTGNVGIGCDRSDTDFSNYKFSVNGNIRAKEVKVYTGWADYVFKEDYALPTLSQVEQHIIEKGHLPNIPSATEVAKEGIYLGEMNAKLLEKIEELTLYTIQQEKEILELKEVKAKNIELEARLSRIEAFIKNEVEKN